MFHVSSISISILSVAVELSYGEELELSCYLLYKSADIADEINTRSAVLESSST
jgi:hypothetical protein